MQAAAAAEMASCDEEAASSQSSPVLSQSNPGLRAEEADWHCCRGSSCCQPQTRCTAREAEALSAPKRTEAQLECVREMDKATALLAGLAAGQNRLK